MSLFDEYVGIDWSGAKSPIKSRAISLSSCITGYAAPQTNPAPLSRDDILQWCIRAAQGQKRILCGIDCNLSYASAIISQQFGVGAHYKNLWESVETISEPHSNLGTENFWNQEPFTNYFWTKGTKPHWFDEKSLRRMTESKCIEQGLGIPESPFKMIGPKQVGKGGLSGMRLAYQLAETLGDKICIWPFFGGIDKATLVLAEIYPRLFWTKVGFQIKKIRDIHELNLAIKKFGSEQIKSDMIFTDHMSDAVISAVGLRDLIENKKNGKENPFLLDKENLGISRIEGWILGV